MDIIYIHDLRIDTVIGVFDWERRVPQTVILDLDMATDIRRAAATDALSDTLNYKAVAKRLLEFVGQSEFQLVETLAERVAELVLSEFPVPWLRLRVNKQGGVLRRRRFLLSGGGLRYRAAGARRGGGAARDRAAKRPRSARTAFQRTYARPRPVALRRPRRRCTRPAIAARRDHALRLRTGAAGRARGRTASSAERPALRRIMGRLGRQGRAADVARQARSGLMQCGPDVREYRVRRDKNNASHRRKADVQQFEHNDRWVPAFAGMMHKGVR